MLNTIRMSNGTFFKYTRICARWYMCPAVCLRQYKLKAREFQIGLDGYWTLDPHSIKPMLFVDGRSIT